MSGPGTRKIPSGAYVALVATAIAFAFAVEVRFAGGAPRNVEVVAHDLDIAIHRSTRYLVRVCDDEGRFTYRVHLDPDREVAPKYNELRHAGAIYAMSMASRRSPDPEVEAAMLRATLYFRERFIGPVPDHDELAAVWSSPSGEGREQDVAKLGGAGIGLVALVSAARDHRGAAPLDELRRLGRFVLWMQKEDGDFYSKLGPDGRDDTWQSLYYPGEAAFGLALLYTLDPDPAWANGAAHALEFLAESRRGDKHLPPDHWALLATGAVLPLVEAGVVDSDVTSEELVAHAAQIAHSMLADARPHPTDPVLGGGFMDDGRTTPTATRLEGLIAAWSYLPPAEVSLRRRIRMMATDGMGFLTRAQVADGEHRGAIPRAVRSLGAGEDTPEEVEAFNARAREVRIDYVQHALSAMVQYRETWPEP